MASSSGRDSGVFRLDMRFMKVVGWIVSLIVVCIGGVLYLEHRHQTVIEMLTETRADLRHLDSRVGDQAESRRLSNDRIYKALDALQKNDRELAVQVIDAKYCCETSAKKGSAKKNVKKGKVGDVLPYALTFKDNPGVIVHSQKEK